MLLADLRALKEAAVCGALHLDHRLPGWVDSVHLPSLDMGSNEKCVGGQITAGVYFEPDLEDLGRSVPVSYDGDYESFLDEMVGPLEYLPADEDWQTRWARAHGFWPLHAARPAGCSVDGALDEEEWHQERREYEVLTRFWRVLVKARS